ncbi:MAG: peptidylprolyl isomerase [Mariprofundales bacterium]
MSTYLKYFAMTAMIVISVIATASWLDVKEVEAKEIQSVNDVNNNWPTHPPKPGDANVPEGNQIKITTANGDILIELYPDVAPNTVANFKALAGSGFYNGLKFHRVISGFMAQGGDPKGTGTGGPGYSVKAEFNAKKHIAGTLAMARSGHPDSAGSQFYICFGTQPHLDGQYTVFGQVIEGMDAVNKIQQGDIMSSVTVIDNADK